MGTPSLSCWQSCCHSVFSGGSPLFAMLSQLEAGAPTGQKGDTGRQPDYLTKTLSKRFNEAAVGRFTAQPTIHQLQHPH